MGAQASAIGEQLRRAIEGIVKALALKIDKELRDATPVGTGHARANWVPSVGAPHASIETGASSAAHDAGVATVLAYKLELGPIWVTNNVPYVIALNDGSSEQQPAGFIERAIDEALDEVRDRVNSLGGDIAGNVANAFSPFGGGDD